LEIIELLVVISIIALLIGILLPALGAARRTARQIQNSTQLRGIHQGMVIFAQSNKSGSGEGWFAGVDSRGREASDTDSDLNGNLPAASATNGTYGGAGADEVSLRHAILLNANAYTPEYAINPGDTGKTPASTETDGDATIDETKHSYAMLDLVDVPAAADFDQDQVKSEWRETINTSAIVMMDRKLDNNGDDVTGNQGTFGANEQTVWSDSGYKGTMTRNDGSTNFESNDIQDGLKYGTGTTVDDVAVLQLMRFD